MAYTTGLRFDNLSGLDPQLSPRVAVNFTPSDQWFMRGSVARGYRLPSMVESEIVAGHFTHDPDLDVETITAAEWGIQHQSHSLRLSSNVYYQRADDLITFKPLSQSEMLANESLPMPYCGRHRRLGHARPDL